MSCQKPVADASVNTARRTSPVELRTPRPRLDQIDLELLKCLAADARLSQRALGRAVNMSAPAVSDRIARLEELGIIQGYRAVVNHALLDRPMTVIIGVSSERSVEQRELAQTILQIPEVEMVELVTGSADLQVRMRLRDQAHLNEVFFDRLLSLPGIRHTHTALAMLSFEPDNFLLNVLDSLPDTRQADGVA